MVARLTMTDIKPENLYINVLPHATQKAFAELISFRFLASGEWYLAGGTALALQAGHRQSVDLDFFTPSRTINPLDLEKKLLAHGVWNTDLSDEGTLYGRLFKAKVSFIAYPFFIPSKKRVRCGLLSMLVPKDIAAMKIIAISQRGRKRDFVDLYWYCYTQNKPLGDVIRYALEHYPQSNHNLPHLIKSLVYFEDAEKDPMPTIFFDATWNTIKKYFQKEVPRITKKLLHLE